MKKEKALALTTPFDRSKIKKTRGMDYIPIAEVVARMNEVVGVGKWRVEILNVSPWGAVETLQGPAPAHIVASVRVHMYDDELGDWTWCDGTGGQDVGFYNPKGGQTLSAGPLNLGDSHKGACSDATKKALQHFGVGLELARDGVALDLTGRVIDMQEYIINQIPDQDVRKQLGAAWKTKFKFKSSAVPDGDEEEALALIREFVSKMPKATESAPAPEASSDDDDPFTPKFPMNQPKAKKTLLAYMNETFADEAIAKPQMEAVWTKSKNASSAAEIGPDIWRELTRLADEAIDAFFKEAVAS